MLKINQVLNLTIEKLSQGSGGIGYFDSKAIFVPYTVPGDQVRVRVVEIKKKYGRGQLLEVIKPSSKRVFPPCLVFGKCGGCQWQMLSYQDQLNFKQEFLQRQVQYLSHKQNESVSLMPIVPSPQPLRYRRRLRLKVKGEKVGYFADSSHQFVEIEDCLLGQKGLVSYLREHLKSKRTSKIKTYEVDKDPISLNYSIRDLNLGIPSFTQVNPEVNRLLVETSGSWVRDGKLLVESSKWKLKKVQAFDMFPQTDHFEILSLFSKNT
jgi:23S rRNA (uracil1939-C5)-methyltransferase